MSKIAVNEITDEVGTGAPAFPNGMSVTGAALTDPEITGGIYLGGTGSANYLDDYEEGTWTPDFLAGDGGPSIKTDTQEGLYTKVGRVVTIHFRNNCDTTSSSQLHLTGLPFNISSSRAARTCVSGESLSFGNASVLWYTEGFGAPLPAYRSDNGASAEASLADGVFRGTITYITDS